MNLKDLLRRRRFDLPVLTGDRPYVVGTGWWCDGTGTHSGARVKTNPSTDFIRTRAFFSLWHHFVDKYTSPEKILIVDSASPVRPELPEDPRIEFVSLAKNWGHYIDCDLNEMCGVERAHLACAFYAFLNDCDLVYIEQDCLVVGQGWLEHCRAAMRNGRIMFGDGRKTPQPIQQSLAIVSWHFLPEFCARLIDQYTRHSALANKEGTRKKHNPEWRWRDAFRRDADYLPMGYGRQRPINFSDKHFYAQHWTESELRQLAQREGLDLKFNQ